LTDPVRVPFHRPDVGEEEVAAVSAVLRSGWLTTGSQCAAFEQEFAAAVGVRYAVAVNSCTAALHLALEASGCHRGDYVLVPTMTFAATAEIVAYFGAIPVLIDCDRETLNLDVAAAARTIDDIQSGRGRFRLTSSSRRIHAMLPVHYGGQMADVEAVAALAKRYGIRVIEDAAHAYPAAARAADGSWRPVGTTAEQTCFSFYANKTMTTGEGGMLVTNDEGLASRVRCMSLHGLSGSAWTRFAAGGNWDYQIIAPGFKYNLTDIAAAIGRAQLKKAASLRDGRARVVGAYQARLGDLEELELPASRPDRQHAWHLYPLRLRLERLTIDRRTFIDKLNQWGISTSVHYRPLHFHQHYKDSFGYLAEDFPVASAEWERLISLPLFPSLTESEIERVAQAVRGIVLEQRKSRR
jgi:perosamine synthetase